MKHHTQKKREKQEKVIAVAVFRDGLVEGEVVAEDFKKGIKLRATFTKLPPGKHGFHIHKAGDLRGEGCKGACSHFHMGTPMDHGSEPNGKKGQKRHTGDLGNIELRGEKSNYEYFLWDCKVRDLFGRAMIVHADEDDLGLGSYDDSKTTGHSGLRIGCAIFGRATSC